MTNSQSMDELIARLEDSRSLPPGCRGVPGNVAVEAADTIIRLREALEQIAGNNWRDQSRAKFVARQALTTKTDTNGDKA